MQVIIKKRLNQDVWLTQQNSSSSTDTSHSTSSHSELKFQKNTPTFLQGKGHLLTSSKLQKHIFYYFLKCQKIHIYPEKKNNFLYNCNFTFFSTLQLHQRLQELHLLLQEEEENLSIRDNPNKFNHSKVDQHLFKILINSKPGIMFMILSYLSSQLSLVSYFIGDLLFQWMYLLHLRIQLLNLVICHEKK